MITWQLLMSSATKSKYCSLIYSQTIITLLLNVQKNATSKILLLILKKSGHYTLWSIHSGGPNKILQTRSLRLNKQWAWDNKRNFLWIMNFSNWDYPESHDCLVRISIKLDNKIIQQTTLYYFFSFTSLLKKFPCI